MSDHKRLRDKVAEILGTDPGATPATRKLQAADPAGLIRAMLQEADETVLSRLVSFENQHGQTIGMEIANRRILRFIQLPPSDGPNSDAAIIDQPIAQATGAQADQLRELLNGFLENTAVLQVRTSKMTRATDPAEIGCAPEALADAWGVALNGEAAQDTSIQDFVSAAQATSLAWLYQVADDEPAQSGKADDMKRLQALFKADLATMHGALDKCGAEMSGRRCVVVRSPDADAPALIYVQSGAARAAFLLDAKQLPDMLRHWHTPTEAD